MAKRRQIPLRLAYGITIHKSQGMTLPNVTVCASDVFAPGQLSVALGRATTTDGLRVVGFDQTRHIIKVNLRKHVTFFRPYVSFEG